MFENHVLHSKTVFMLGDAPNMGTSNCKESCVELEEQEAALCKAVHLKKNFFFLPQGMSCGILVTRLGFELRPSQ